MTTMGIKVKALLTEIVSSLKLLFRGWYDSPILRDGQVVTVREAYVGLY